MHFIFSQPYFYVQKKSFDLLQKYLSQQQECNILKLSKAYYYLTQLQIIVSVKSTLKKQSLIMKNLLTVLSKYSSTFTKLPSLSFELNTLLSKLKVSRSPKLQYLHSLSSQEEFRKHFDERTVKQLSAEDIVIYLQHRDKFTNAPYFVRKEIVKKDNLDAYFKFLISAQLQMLEDPKHQLYLVKILNQSVYRLLQQELLYCLEKIFSFELNISKQLHLRALEQKVNTFQDGSYIQGIYYLIKFNDKIQIQKSKLMDCIAKLSNTSTKRVFMLKKILQKSVSLKLSQQQQQKVLDVASHCIKTCKDYQLSYAIGLLEFFPALRPLISLQHISSKDYLLYLRIQPNSLKYHPLPSSILDDLNAYIFKDIVKQRVKLDFNRPIQFAFYLKSHITPGMQGILGLIKYLSQEQIQDSIVWANLEHIIIQQFQLSLNITQKQMTKVISKHQLASVLKIFGAMAISKQGSMTFWKYVYSFVYKVLKEQQFLKLTNPEDQKNLIIYLHQIFTHKQPNQQISQTLMQLTLLTLARNKWKIKQLLPLTISLRVSKTGDNELWLGIEKKLMSISIDAIYDSGTKEKLLWILNNFIAMNRGSFYFWTHFSKNLTKQQKETLFEFINNEKSIIKRFLQQ